MLAFTCFLSTNSGMATVYLRPGSGVYYAKFVNKDGKRVSKNTGCSKKREAEAEANRMEAEERAAKKVAKVLPKQLSAIIETAAREAAAGDLTLARAEELLRRLRVLANPDFREFTVCGWFGEWVAEQKAHVGISTGKSYDDALRRMKDSFGPRTASKPLTELTTEEVARAISRTAESVKASTANMDLRAFRRALEAAAVRHYISGNVAKAVRPLPEDDSDERAPFTKEEVRALMAAARDEEWRGLILIAAHSGLRLGDVLKLGRINVEGTDLVIRPDKTKRQRKTIRVPMTPPVIGWIAEKKGAFFPALSAKTVAVVSATFSRLMEKAEVPREILQPGGIRAVRSFHSLRHSFTSWLAEADIHADVRQKLTGHSGSGVHARYTHHDEALSKAIATLPSL